MSKRQVICLHIGQAGVQVGFAIWELLMLEHGVKLTGSIASQHLRAGAGSGVTSFFSGGNPGLNAKYFSRALMVDTESMVIDELRTGPYKNVFHPNCLVSGCEDAANLFPRGYGNVGREVLSPALEGLRMLAETTDNTHGITIVRSYGGGTGSGFTSMFLDEVDSEFSKIGISELVVYPAPCISTSIVEPYNAVLTAFQTMRHINMSLIMDNQALYEICRRHMELAQPSYFNINRIIAQVFSSLTASIRFDSVLGSDFSIYQTNLVPYPRLKYPLISYSPLLPTSTSTAEPHNLSALTDQVFQRNNFMIRCFPEYGEYMACAVLYRGHGCLPREINMAIRRVREGNLIRFVDWSPTGFKIGINRQPPPFVQYSGIAKIKRSICLVANNTCIAQVFDYLLQKFNLLYRRKAYVHWFTGEGLEEAELVEARQGLTTLLLDYMRVGTADRQESSLP